jgi:hypothetical protein
MLWLKQDWAGGENSSERVVTAKVQVQPWSVRPTTLPLAAAEKTMLPIWGMRSGRGSGLDAQPLPPVGQLITAMLRMVVWSGWS